MLLPPPKGSGFPQPNRIYELNNDCICGCMRITHKNDEINKQLYRKWYDEMSNCDYDAASDTAKQIAKMKWSFAKK